MTYRQRKARRRDDAALGAIALLVVFVPLLVVGVALLSAVGYVIAIAADTPPCPSSSRATRARPPWSTPPTARGSDTCARTRSGRRSRGARCRRTFARPPSRSRTSASTSTRAWTTRRSSARASRTSSRDAVQRRLDDHSAARARALHRGRSATSSGRSVRRSWRRAGGRAPRTGREELDPARVPELGSLRDERPPRSASRRPPRPTTRSTPRTSTSPSRRLIAGPAAGAVAVQPVPEPSAALERRNEVLRNMAENDFITVAEAERRRRSRSA